MNKQQFNAGLKRAASDAERLDIHDAYAKGLFDRENYTEALNIYTQALEFTKQQNVKAYLLGKIGICHFNKDEDKTALQRLKKSAQLFQPDKPEFMPDMYGFVLFHIGAIYEYHGKHVQSLEARKACEKYVDSQEKDTQWMLYSGIRRNYEALGRHGEAISYSQKAIQILSDNDPEESYLFESMANSYMEMQQYQEAIQHFSRVLELAPGFERIDEVQMKLANCYRQISNYAMALETYEKILKLKQLTAKSKDLVWIYLKLAECYFRIAQYEKSLLAAFETLQQHPLAPQEKAEALSFKTNNYYELGRYKDAVRDGEKALGFAQRFPNDDLFYVRMALSFHELGDKKSFIKYRAIVRKLFKDDNWNKHLEKLG